MKPRKCSSPTTGFALSWVFGTFCFTLQVSFSACSNVCLEKTDKFTPQPIDIGRKNISDHIIIVNLETDQPHLLFKQGCRMLRSHMENFSDFRISFWLHINIRGGRDCKIHFDQPKTLILLLQVNFIASCVLIKDIPVAESRLPFLEVKGMQAVPFTTAIVLTAIAMSKSVLFPEISKTNACLYFSCKTMKCPVMKKLLETEEFSSRAQMAAYFFTLGGLP